MDGRRSRTRRALIQAAQEFIAEGQLSPPIGTITARAGIGLGSFYNHFTSREQLFESAAIDALEQFGRLVDDLAAEDDDPARRFACGFRLLGRLHARYPAMSKVVLRIGLGRLSSSDAITVRMRRDLRLGMTSGRFLISDIDVALSSITGAALGVGYLVHDHADVDAGAAADESCSYLLRLLGLTPAEAELISRQDLPDLPPRRAPRASTPAESA